MERNIESLLEKSTRNETIACGIIIIGFSLDLLFLEKTKLGLIASAAFIVAAIVSSVYLTIENRGRKIRSANIKSKKEFYEKEFKLIKTRIFTFNLPFLLAICLKASEELYFTRESEHFLRNIFIFVFLLLFITVISLIKQFKFTSIIYEELLKSK